MTISIAPPLIMGTEQELAISINGKADNPDLGQHLPGYHENGGGFMTNGYRAYQDNNHYEIATPECSSPRQLTKYVLASQELALEGLKSYTAQHSVDHEETTASLHNRVADTNGNSWACHDNFHITTHQYHSLTDELGENIAVIRGFLASRSFVTGAGLVSADGLTFSQKNHTLDDIDTYGYTNSHYRIAEADEERFEVRSSDINISPWQTHMRIGSVALALAIADTPMRSDLLQVDKEATRSLTYAMNELHLCPDGTIKASTPLKRAVVNLKSLATNSLELDLPCAYRTIAQELQDYCDDMEAVLTGKATISLLSDRADWAAKFETILRRYHANNKIGRRRSFNDEKSIAQDISYDRHSLTARDGMIVNSTSGWGYMLRDRGKFKFMPPAKAIKNAQTQPPQTTRAIVRTQLLNDYEYIQCDWHRVEFTCQGDERELTLPPRSTSRAKLSPSKG